MSFLRDAPLDEKSGPIAATRENLGFVPNLFRAQSLLPRVVQAHASLENAMFLESGTISKIQKRRILMSVASSRRDAYSVALERRAMAGLGVCEGQIDEILNDHARAGLPAADVALLEFCLRLSVDPLSVSSQDIDGLRAHGFGDESIIEAVFATALAAYRGTLSVGLGPEPDSEPRELPSKSAVSPPRGTLQGSGSGTRLAEQNRGAYVRAPYVNSKTFAPFAGVRDSHGFVPNFFRTQTLRPDLLAPEAEAIAIILQPEDVITRVQKESILLAVSAANLNSYCVAVHCNLLRGLGLSSEEGDQISVDYHASALSEADKALLDFAVKLATNFSEFSREDVARLRAFGFSEEQILESEVVTALNNFANVLQMGLGFQLDFEPPPAFLQNKLHLFAASNSLMISRSSARVTATGIEDPDAELVARARAGDIEAFEALVRRHTQLIYRALAAILGNPDDAQDAMQDALFSAFKHIDGFQGRSKFSTWLVSIARNAALQRLRNRKRDESLDEGAPDDEAEFRPRQVRAWEENPEQSHSRSEIRELIQRGIMGLPAKYRTVVMLRDIEQLSTDEVARQLELSVPAVKVRLLRGRLMLRDWLSPHFASVAKGATQ